MIQTILREKRLKNYLHRDIEDAGICVNVDPGLKESEYIGIKVDDYYAGKHLAVIPKAVDFIVAVDCECDWYALYILELKGVKRQPEAKAIKEKFGTTIGQFMSEEFRDIFLNDRFKYRDLKLYLVTTASRKANELGSYEKYEELLKKTNHRDTLVYDNQLSQKPYRFRGKLYRIQREVPPNPVIRKILN